MGMYTEIFFRAELVRDVPVQVVECLHAMTNFYHQAPEELPDHPLFECSRWEILGCGGSAYFPVSQSSLQLDTYSGQWHVLFLSNLKNYSGEIGHFFDWIDPYVSGSEGEFLGYSLYEESNDPILFHKKSQTAYFKYDKDIYNYWRNEIGLKPIE